MWISGIWAAPEPISPWRAFMEENRYIVENMDCNDEVRDRLKAYVKRIHSDRFKGQPGIFEAITDCPWRMRDLYQFFYVLKNRSRPGMERFRLMKDELGYLRDDGGIPLSFFYLLPEDLGEACAMEVLEEMFMA